MWPEDEVNEDFKHRKRIRRHFDPEPHQSSEPSGKNRENLHTEKQPNPLGGGSPPSHEFSRHARGHCFKDRTHVYTSQEKKDTGYLQSKDQFGTDFEASGGRSEAMI